MNKRTKAIHFRVNKEELEKLDSLVSQYNMRRGAYCRMATLKELAPLIPAINRMTYVELGKIGSNLNQIAKHLNSNSSEAFNFEECLIILNDLRSKLLGLSA